MYKIFKWIEENADEMYNYFINSQPSKEEIRKIVNLMDLKNSKKLKIKDPKDIDNKLFKTALMNYVEIKILKHRG